MAHTEYNTVGNGIRAQDVHDLTQEVLQAHWPLEMEKSYRLMNSVRARTASTSVTLRLLLVAVAFLLLNL